MKSLLELLVCLPAPLVVAWLLLGLVRAARIAAKELNGTVVNFTSDGVAVIRCPDTPSATMLASRGERQVGIRIKVV